MNENQLNFLGDLAKLFRKYNIDSVEDDNGSIVFWSNGQTLSFSYYQNGRFECVDYHCGQDYYAPETN